MTDQQPEGFELSVPSLKPRTPMVIDGILYYADAVVALWLNDRLGGSLPLVPYVAFGIVAEGTPEGNVQDLGKIRLAAAAYFFNHYKGPDQFDVSCAVVAEDVNTGRPGVIRKILDYPFGSGPDKLDCHRISAEIHASNRRCIEQAEKLGFKLEGRKRGAGSKDASQDILMYGLLRSECQLWAPMPN